MGTKKQKYQDTVTTEMNQSRKAMSALVSEVSKSNELYKRSTDRLESASNRLEDIKFLQALPKGSTEYRSVLEEYMKQRDERRMKRKRGSEEDVGGEENVDDRTDD